MRRRVLVALGLGAAVGALALGSALLPASFLVQPAQARTQVKKVRLTDVRVKVSPVRTRYRSGRAIRPKPTVKFEKTKLRAGRQYSLSYSGNIEAGTAKIRLRAAKAKFAYKGRTYRLTGSRTVKFKIADPVAARLSKKAWYFTGSAVKPKVTVTYKGKKLAKGGYTVAYSGNTRVGTAKARITGKGAYAGLVGKTLTFKIRKADTSYSLNKFSGARTSDAERANGLYAASKKADVKKSFDTINTITDLSVWDGNVNWTKAEKKIDVAFLRSYVTYREHRHYKDGKKMLADACYDSYASSCESLKLPYAAYGYLIFTNSTDSLSKAKKDAKAQAKKFWNASFSKGHAPLYLILDVEDENMAQKNPSRVASCTKAAIDQLQKCALAAGYGNGVKIGLYVGNHVYGTFGFETSAGRKVLDDQVDFVWIPSYGKNNGKVPTARKHFPTYAFDLWQYTSAGKISGISGKVDVSLVNTAGPNAHDITWYKER